MIKFNSLSMKEAYRLNGCFSKEQCEFILDIFDQLNSVDLDSIKERFNDASDIKEAISALSYATSIIKICEKSLVAEDGDKISEDEMADQLHESIQEIEDVTDSLEAIYDYYETDTDALFSALEEVTDTLENIP